MATSGVILGFVLGAIGLILIVVVAVVLVTLLVWWRKNTLETDALQLQSRHQQNAEAVDNGHVINVHQHASSGSGSLRQRTATVADATVHGAVSRQPQQQPQPSLPTTPRVDETNRIGLYLIEEATNNFNEDRVIGSGSFGNVYKGELRDKAVAVKRRRSNSDQGTNEFHAEIGLVSGLRHCNLVSLIGYCDESNEMILVYEYMEKGTLRSHLYDSDKPSWEQRLKICIGAAEGLHYLHTGTVEGKGIIHRDVKSSNILLDANLVAKVSDFGLSKIGPGLEKSHVSTLPKGTFGYLDPEYFQTGHLTKKSDVYSFGVVLVEVLCARKVVIEGKDENLAQEAMKLLNSNGRLKGIVDNSIKHTIELDSLKNFFKIVKKCLAEKRVDRPSMEEVLSDLRCVLNGQSIPETQLQVKRNFVSELTQMKRMFNKQRGEKNLEKSIAMQLGVNKER